jgi:hypothetical protein
MAEDEFGETEVREEDEEVGPKPKKPLRHMMDRKEFARRVGLTVQGVRYREKVGLLKPAKKGTGLYAGRRGTFADKAFYTQEQVERERRRQREDKKGRPAKSVPVYATSHECRVVFEALARGMTVRDIVREYGIHYEAVMLLADKYSIADGGIFLRPEEVDAINKLPLDGCFPVKTGADIVALLEEASREKCEECVKRPRRYCRTCVTRVANKLARDLIEEIDE